MWLGRFEGPPLKDYRLDEILYRDFNSLRSARAREDQRIRSFIHNMSDEFVMGALTWTNNAGKTNTQGLSLLLTHFFNHQTHHRGQVHNMLSQAGVQTPVLDLPWILVDP